MLTSPSCSCCDESCTSLCSGDEPSTLLVSIGGFLDDVGTCCSPINGNYVLTYSDVDCRWSYLEGSYCSSYILLIDVWITDEGGGNYKINLQVQVTTGLSVQVLLIRFSETVVGMPDCCDWDTLSLTLDFVVENDTATFDCDTTSIAAYITSFCGGDAFGESEGYSSATARVPHCRTALRRHRAVRQAAVSVPCWSNQWPTPMLTRRHQEWVLHCSMVSLLRMAMLRQRLCHRHRNVVDATG